MVNENRKAFLYGRVSTVRQGDEGTSLTTQEQRARALAAKRDFTVLPEHVIFEQGSGADPLRAGFLKLQNAVKMRLVDAVIVFSHDRLARDPLDLLNFARMCSEHEVELIFVHGPSGTQTDVDELIQFILGFFGKRERDEITERTVRGKLEKAQEEQRLPNGCGRGIYGYDYNPVTKTRSINRLEANIVEKIFLQFTEGKSFHYIAKELNRKGIPSKSGRKWHPLTVRRIVMNESYIGTDYYNRTRTRMLKGGGKYVDLRPREKWVVITGFSPPIVSKQLFQVAQERMAMPRPASNRAQRRYLLTGFTRCGFCGTPVTGLSMQKGRYRYYRCRATGDTAASPPTCKARHIRADELEATVWSHVCGTLESPEIAIAELQEFMETGDGELGREIARLRKEISKCRQAEANLLSLVNHEEFDPDLLRSQMAPISAMRKRHEEQLNQLEQQQALHDDAKEAERRITEYCRLVSEGLDKLDYDGKRSTLSAFNVRVTATREDVSIVAVVDPSVLDQKLSTIERTSALRRACTNSLQSRPRA